MLQWLLILRGGVTASMAVCLLYLGYLLLVAPDAKSNYSMKKGLFEENMNIGKLFRNG